jgi:hypothetical protein
MKPFFRSALHRHLGLLLCTLLIASAAGCNILATMMYVVQGQNVPGDYNGLRGKRVVVVCRPSPHVQFTFTSVPKELASGVGALLQNKVDRIHVVKQREVDEWVDSNNLDGFDYVQIGKQLKADMVVGIDLEEFSLAMDQTLYQGKATISMAVYDMHRKDKESVWEKHLAQIVYPPSTPIAAADMPESQFRRKFVKVLGDMVGRHFYEHDPTADFANDSTAYNNN